MILATRDEADMDHHDRAGPPALAPRERDVLRLVADGMADKQIARELGIGQSTVKEYLKRIRARYAEAGRPAPSRVDLCRRALEDGLL